jgi:hypothetical protein
MITKNKYLIYSFIFIASISLHSYADHHDHFSFEEELIEDCQACEENVDVKVTTTKNKSNFAKIFPKTNLITRFVSSKNKSNLSRAPPVN